MRLIVLYGPPAVGKYTIAKAVAEKTGYKFFHNHLSLDVAKSVFEFAAPGFFELSDQIRLDVFEAAAKQGVAGIVFTFVFNKATDANFVQAIIDTVAKYNGDVQFFQLHCDKEQLLKRVEAKHRKEMKKLVSPDELQKLLEEGEFQSAIPNVESTMVDNTNLAVDETVEKVLANIK